MIIDLPRGRSSNFNVFVIWMTYLEGQKLFWKQLFGQADLSKRIFLHNFLDVHRQHRLGLLWVIINPCIPLIVYNSMQFLGIFKDTSADIPRSVHLTLGLLIYYAFSDALNSFAVCLPQNGQYILRGGVSKLSVYTGTLYEVLSNFVIMFVAFIVLSYSVGYRVGLTVLCIPLVGLIAISLGSVLGVILSVFYVYYRDLGNVLRMFTFYLLFGSGDSVKSKKPEPFSISYVRALVQSDISGARNAI